MTQNLVNDASALAFISLQARGINTRAYATRYPEYDFARLIFVETSGNPWAPGVMTFTSSESGKARLLTAYSKDMPKAEVGQAEEMRTFKLAGIGYDYNIEEVNTALAVVGGTLTDRKAAAARRAYAKYMFNTAITGIPDLPGSTGLTNYTGVTATAAPADGTGGVRTWVDAADVGTKTPAQIVRDINIGIVGIFADTYQTELADTVMLPLAAYAYIAQTPYSLTTQETILTFIQRTNLYTLQTGRPLNFVFPPQGVLEAAGTASGATGTGRMVVYKNDPEYVRLHLPMPHQFLPVYQDGWGHFEVPGIFRTGGVEILSTQAVRYIDGITPAP